MYPSSPHPDLGPEPTNDAPVRRPSSSSNVCPRCQRPLEASFGSCAVCGAPRPPGGWPQVDPIPFHHLGRPIAQDVVIDGLLGARDGLPVYLARHRTFHARFVVRLLDVSRVAPATVRHMLDWAEAVTEAMAGERSPHLARVYGASRADPKELAVLLEYVGGEPLERRLSAAPMDLTSAVAIARNVALALHAAHRLGLHHGALSPSSVILRGSDGRPPVAKVVDVGLRDLRSVARLERSTLPVLGQPAGLAAVRLDLLGLAGLLESLVGEEHGPLAPLLRGLRQGGLGGYRSMMDVVHALAPL